MVWLETGTDSGDLVKAPEQIEAGTAEDDAALELATQGVGLDGDRSEVGGVSLTGTDYTNAYSSADTVQQSGSLSPSIALGNSLVEKSALTREQMCGALYQRANRGCRSRRSGRR
jgi:hypothetical protein